MLGQRVLDPPGFLGSDVLGDHERVAQVRGGLGPTTGQQAAADSRQGAGFFDTRADLPGDAQRLAVTAAGILGRRRGQRQVAEAVQQHGLAVPVAEFPEQLQGLREVAGRAPVVPGRQLYLAQPAGGPGLPEPVAEAAE